jgi:hypothetical protein
MTVRGHRRVRARPAGDRRPAIEGAEGTGTMRERPGHARVLVAAGRDELGIPISRAIQELAAAVQGQLCVTHAAPPHLVRSAEDSPRRAADLVIIRSAAGR